MLSRLLTYLLAIGAFSAQRVRVARAGTNSAATQSPATEKHETVLRSKEPALILGSLQAVSQDMVVESESSSADVMLLKVEKVLSGKSPGKYVRADFNHHSETIAPKTVPMKRQLLILLRAGKIMKIRLRPPISGAECTWTIPAPPQAGEEVGLEHPIMVPVGGTNRYPDINSLPCFGFELNAIQEVN
jgi:hypothetical protein